MAFEPKLNPDYSPKIPQERIESADKQPTETKESKKPYFGRKVSRVKEKDHQSEKTKRLSRSLRSSSRSEAQSPEATVDSTNYLDENRLLKGKAGDQPIKSTHREWYLNEATLLELMSRADRATKKQLELILLHGYSKAATVGTENSDTLAIQTTPFMHQDERYHRSTPNILLDSLNDAFAEDMKIKPHELIPIDSPLLSEVFTRELPQPGLNLNIHDKQAFENLVDALLANAQSGQFPTDSVLIDFTKYLNAHPTVPEEIQQKIVREFEDILMSKIKEFIKKNPNIKPEDISDKLMSKLHLIAFTQHKGQHLLLLPEFLIEQRFESEGNALINRGHIRNRHGKVFRDLGHMMIRTGFRVSPDQAKEAFLKLKAAKAILQSLNLPIAQLATKGTNIPIIFKSFDAFMQAGVVNKFRNLSKGYQLAKDQQLAPYLQILPEATWRLLDGLARYTENGGVHQEFKKRKIGSLLQLSYFRMMNAMNEAILRRDDQMAFQNQIELIHQEIQNILAIIQPYDDQDFAKAVVERLTNGISPVISKDLDPKVQLKASAMHGLSSIIAGVEAEKGSNQLNVAVLKDSYYESSDALKHAKTHTVHILDGDRFNQGGIDKAFQTLPAHPIDLFVCEFHHNISVERQSYKPENILKQVKDMVAKKGFVADKFTIAIDTTIDLEKSEEIGAFLADETIKTLIRDGKLNVVFLRSAQKFDMLGIDNYYGGITTTINDGKVFGNFNSRMNKKEDQLQGLSYQGLTHLERYSGISQDLYRLGIMSNTRKLYQALPKEAVYRKGTKNPMQISEIVDKRLVFLDIKFPQYPDCAKAFKYRLLKFAKDEKLPFTRRPSFGFPNTNFTVIDRKKFRLNPGLEDEQTLAQYQKFFYAVQKAIDEVLAETNTTTTGANPPTQKEIDRKIAARIRNLEIS